MIRALNHYFAMRHLRRAAAALHAYQSMPAGQGWDGRVAWALSDEVRRCQRNVIIWR